MDKYATAKSVCVVIVNYNDGAMVTECVRSVLRSTTPVNVYVSDNGSTDNSVAYLRLWFGNEPRVRIVENGENLGFAKGNNAVLPLCRCDYVLFLNPDCIVQPDTIEEMTRIMEQHPDAAMASALLVNPDGSEQAGCRRYVPTPWRCFVRVFQLHRFVKNHPRFQSFVMTGLPLPEAPQPVEAISGAFMLVRRDVINAVGPMDDNYFLHCEDLDWCMRFRAAGWKILFVPHVRVMHWMGLSSEAHPVKVEYHKHRGMLRFYNKFFRHQYRGLMMGMVFGAVCARFVLKTGWIMVRDLFPRSNAGRAARISVETVEQWRKEQGANRDVAGELESGDSLIKWLDAPVSEIHESSHASAARPVNRRASDGASLDPRIPRAPVAHAAQARSDRPVDRI